MGGIYEQESAKGDTGPKSSAHVPEVRGVAFSVGDQKGDYPSRYRDFGALNQDQRTPLDIITVANSGETTPPIPYAPA
ncbi:hypothetical protein TMatcc_003443 [Talaromyces marneffei ATCC 18224]